MRDLQHPLGPLPWALSNCDGILKKTNKSTLARHTDGRVITVESIPSLLACIIDGMSRTDIVFDVYKEKSIKTAERASCEKLLV